MPSLKSSPAAPATRFACSWSRVCDAIFRRSAYVPIVSGRLDRSPTTVRSRVARWLSHEGMAAGARGSLS